MTLFAMDLMLHTPHYWLTYHPKNHVCHVPNNPKTTFQERKKCILRTIEYLSVLSMQWCVARIFFAFLESGFRNSFSLNAAPCTCRLWIVLYRYL